MGALIISTFILFGFLLIAAEIFFIPGTTIVGILGIILLSFGIFYTYDDYGNTIGNYVLIGSLISTLIGVYFSFKAKTWRFMQLDSTIDTKIHNVNSNLISINDEGIAKSAIRPMGTASFHDELFEVESEDGFIEVNSKIKIISISKNTIIVKKI